MQTEAKKLRYVLAALAGHSGAGAVRGGDPPAPSVTSAPLAVALLYTAFSAGLSPFTASGNCTPTNYEEAPCEDTASLTETFSTANARSISVMYYRSTSRYDVGERLFVEYS